MSGIPECPPEANTEGKGLKRANGNCLSNQAVVHGRPPDHSLGKGLQHSIGIDVTVEVDIEGEAFLSVDLELRNAVELLQSQLHCPIAELSDEALLVMKRVASERCTSVCGRLPDCSATPSLSRCSDSFVGSPVTWGPPKAT